MPVVQPLDHGRLVGLLSMTDIVRAQALAARDAGAVDRTSTPPTIIPLKTLDLVPLPTNDALVNNFQGPISPARSITDEVTARIDYHISAKDTFYGRYIYNFNHDFVGDLFPLFGPGSSDRSYRRNRHNQNVSLSETHIFTSSLFNEARAGWNRSFTFEELETSFKNDITTQLGISDQLPLTRDPLEWGPPNFAISQSSSVLGLPGLRTGAPWNPNGGQIWHFADNLSIVRGKHSFKTGGTIMRRNDVFIETLTARGSFNFGSAPGGALASRSGSSELTPTARASQARRAPGAAPTLPRSAPRHGS